MPKVSLTNKLSADGKTMVQKGPAPDYSMLLQMKRRSILVAEAKTVPAGRKNMGVVVDNPKTRGFDEGPVKPVLITRGATLGFFRF